MKIDIKILNNLTAQAKCSERLRENLDLRNSPNDKSQRMLNALEPGTMISIHRHIKTSETVVVLRGAVRQNFYDDNGNLIDYYIVSASSNFIMFVVPKGVWHNTEALESGTVVFTSKDGEYEPSENWRKVMGLEED